MKLSEYIHALQHIAKQLKREGKDPEVCIGRYSDLTTRVTREDWPSPDREGMDEFPRVVKALPCNPRTSEKDSDWLTREHSSMSDEQKAMLKEYVELAPGN